MSVRSRLDLVHFLSTALTVVCLGPALSHLLELPHKMELSRLDYFVVQQVYRLGSLSFVPILAALLLTLALVFLVRPWRSVFNLALTALLCIAGAQAVFWLLTHPVNVATENWTVLPEAWEPLRAQWELSQAIVAILMLCAASALILSLIARTRRAH